MLTGCTTSSVIGFLDPSELDKHKTYYTTYTKETMDLIAIFETHIGGLLKNLLLQWTRLEDLIGKLPNRNQGLVQNIISCTIIMYLRGIEFINLLSQINHQFIQFSTWVIKYMEYSILEKQQLTGSNRMPLPTEDAFKFLASMNQFGQSNELMSYFELENLNSQFKSAIFWQNLTSNPLANDILTHIFNLDQFDTKFSWIDIVRFFHKEMNINPPQYSFFHLFDKLITMVRAIDLPKLTHPDTLH